MNVDESLFARLSTYSGLTSLISTRVYPIILPQTVTLPAVTYQTVAGVPLRELGSVAKAATRLYQVTAFGETLTSAKSVSAQVVACLDNFTGQLGGTGGVQAVITQASEERLNFDQETEWFYIVTDFEVFYQR